jgi:hypothetical protein
MNGKDNEKGANKPNKIASFLKGTAKAYNKIHPKSKYDSTQDATNLSKSYSDAEKLLQDKTYAERVKPLQTFWDIIVFGYPVLSVIFAILAGYFISDFASSGTGFNYWSSFIPVFIGIIIFAVVVELLKNYTSVQLFRYGKNVGAVLFIWTLCSIVLSGGGGYIASFKLADKSEQINQDFASQNDSIRNQYLSQISDFEGIITKNKKLLSKKNIPNWQVNVASESLQKAQKSKSELLAKIESSTDKLTAKKESFLTSDITENYKRAGVVGIIVLLLEILYIFGQSSKYGIARKLVNENRNHNFVHVEEEVETEKPQTLTLESLGMQLILNQLSGQNIPTNISPIAGLNTETDAPETGSKTGFKFGTNSEPETEKKQDKTSKKGLSKLKRDTLCTPLLTDVLSGERHTPTLQSKHGKNLNTVRSYIAYAENPYPII